MNYSKYRKKNPKMVEMQRKQNEIIEKARKERLEAQSLEERHMVEAKKRSDLKKLAMGEESKKEEAPIVPEAPKGDEDKEPKMVDLKSREEVEEALKSLQGE